MEVAATILHLTLLLLAMLVAQIDGACKKINSCSCRLDNGMVIDLKEVGKTDGTPRFKDLLSTSDYYYYSYNPCADFTQGGDCTNVAACQKSSPGTVTLGYDLGDQASAEFVTEGSNLYLQYTGSGTTDPTKRTSKVKLVCTTTGTLDALIAYGETSQGSVTYAFDLLSPHCCGKEDPGGGGSGGLSAGSILCIIALVLVIVYLVGGILFMKFVKHETGTDLIPNKGFWASLPGYIKDGFLFAISPCRKGGNDAYNEI